MDLTLHIPDEAVPALKARASGLPLETFAAKVLLEQIHDERSQTSEATVADAARRLGNFGKRHGLSLSGMTIRDLLDESRP
jgi:hypothetical protein